ncbi:hypothetical protein M5K25_016718 [Dendrobium thyrsiflorum]|uniref:Uncharacterized protein n=1 Tax=Dendrobium thyrsiflorum TaxID=117978 RepID=A0ABD0USL0_DENTH
MTCIQNALNQYRGVYLYSAFSLLLPTILPRNDIWFCWCLNWGSEIFYTLKFFFFLFIFFSISTGLFYCSFFSHRLQLLYY